MKKLLAGLAITASLAIAPTAAFAAGKHGGTASQMGCSLSSSGVGSPLVLTGSGYAAGGNYQVYFAWPQSASGVSGSEAYATADGAGNIAAQDYTYWAGKYTATVQSGTKVLASCSVSVS